MECAINVQFLPSVVTLHERTASTASGAASPRKSAMLPAIDSSLLSESAREVRVEQRSSALTRQREGQPTVFFDVVDH